MRSFRLSLILALSASLLSVSLEGCKTFGPRGRNESAPRSRVIKRESGESSTVEGWVGGERPSFKPPIEE